MQKQNVNDPITDAVDYYGHEKTGNEYLTGVYTNNNKKKGSRKWFVVVICAILELYAMNRDRLKLLRQIFRFVVISHSS